jgi:hypothetical protein
MDRSRRFVVSVNATTMIFEQTYSPSPRLSCRCCDGFSWLSLWLCIAVSFECRLHGSQAAKQPYPKDHCASLYSSDKDIFARASPFARKLQFQQFRRVSQQLFENCELSSLATISTFGGSYSDLEVQSGPKIRFEQRAGRKVVDRFLLLSASVGLYSRHFSFKNSCLFLSFFVPFHFKSKCLSRRASKMNRATYILLIAESLDLEPIVALSIERSLTTRT